MSKISIHAPRVGVRRVRGSNYHITQFISIHAPRVGVRRKRREALRSLLCNFNPRTPCRSATEIGRSHSQRNL